jgi:hypothetical protein
MVMQSCSYSETVCTPGKSLALRVTTCSPKYKAVAAMREYWYPRASSKLDRRRQRRIPAVPLHPAQAPEMLGKRKARSSQWAEDDVARARQEDGQIVAGFNAPAAPNCDGQEDLAFGATSGRHGL